MHVRIKSGLELPLRESPIRFAVMMTNGQTSNAWGVHVEDTGDAYIYCRDSMKQLKVSLHRSGKQHIAFTKESGLEMPLGNRFWNQWREPQHGSHAIPTFKLMFPNWGTRLGEEDRAEETWNKNQILIGADDKLLTTVSFVILDKRVTPRIEDELPSFLIGTLPLGPEKKLWIIARGEPEGNLREKVEEAIKEMEEGIRGTNEEAAKRTDISKLSPEKVVGEILHVCMTGKHPSGFAFLVMLDVSFSDRGADSQDQGSGVR